MTAVSVTGLGTYLPEQRMTAADIATASGLPEWVVTDKLGIREKRLPGPDDHTNVMGLRAAEQALADAGIQADEIDVVISINEEHKDYPVWTSGIKLAHDLGASRAWAYDIGQKCGTSVLALKQARDLLVADPRVDTVLIAGGYRNCDLIDYQDPNVRFLYNLAAGGAAVVVQRTDSGHRILDSAFRTDGAFSLDVIVPVGGTREPLRPDNVGEYRLTVPDPAGMKSRLDAKSMANFVGVVEDALERSGRAPADVDHVAMLHMKRSAHDHVLDTLGIAQDRSIYLADYGHMGQVDQILSLQLAASAGRLSPGSLAVLVAAGIGYVWNALCLEWGAR
ncbi:MAG: 3-oxoacyl-ACP synthase [Pseudomonadota bacterium]|nr:3-oxoacyl-ACP synthase [Pseudomonadota bacterium]